MSCVFGPPYAEGHVACRTCHECGADVCEQECVEFEGPHACACVIDSTHLYICESDWDPHSKSHALDTAAVFPSCSVPVSRGAVEAGVKKFRNRWKRMRRSGKLEQPTRQRNLLAPIDRFLNVITPGSRQLAEAAASLSEVRLFRVPTIWPGTAGGRYRVRGRVVSPDYLARVVVLAGYELAIAYNAGAEFPSRFWRGIAESASNWIGTNMQVRPEREQLRLWVRIIAGGDEPPEERRKLDEYTATWLEAAFELYRVPSHDQRAEWLLAGGPSAETMSRVLDEVIAPAGV